MTFDTPDPDFDRRWAEWKAKGRAHERAVRRRLAVVATVAAPCAAVALVIYVLFRA